MVIRVVILLLILGTVYAFNIGDKNLSADSGTKEAIASPWVITRYEPESPFPLRAKAGIVLNRKTGEIIYEKNQEMVLPIASLAKLMTAMVVLEGEEVDRDLFYKMLVYSDNNAAEKLLGGRIAKMNKKAKELGMESSYFADASGLSPETVSTVSDLVKLTRASFNYPRIWEALARPVYNRTPNTNKLLGKYGVIAGKTGFTDQAGECLMLLTDDLITIVLNAEDRFEASEGLLDLFSNVK